MSKETADDPTDTADTPEPGETPDPGYESQIAYDVEVAKSNGSEVDVHLDRAFKVLGTATDHADDRGDGDQDGGSEGD